MKALIGASLPGHCEYSRRFVDRSDMDMDRLQSCDCVRWSQMAAVAPLESKAEKWESGSVTSSNSSHFDFSSNADEVFSHITGLPDTVSAAEFITL